MAKFDKKVFLALHLLLLFYSCSSVLSKLAAGHEFLSLGFLVCYGGMFMILVIYAVGWQQILKHLPLTVAFANKAVVVLWGILWSALLFGETIRPNMIIGAAIIVAGVYLVGTCDE